MPWTPPAFTPAVVWQNRPNTNTPLSASDLNLEAAAEAAYAAQVGTSVATYFEGGSSPSVPTVAAADARYVLQSDAPIDVKLFGAKGDGVTDDTTSVRTAFAATPNGGTLYFPPGQYLITGTITCNSQITVQGAGSGSGILLNVGSGNDGLVFASVGGGQIVSGVQLVNFAIYGAANSCRNALVLRDLYAPIVSGVRIRAGAVNYGLTMAGVLDARINVLMGSNMSFPYSGVAPANGINVFGSASFPSNANRLDCYVGGIAGIGILIDGSTGTAGSFNNWVSGTYEGITGRGVWFKSCTEFHLYDAHIEGGAFANQNELRIENSQRGQIGPGVLAGASVAGHNTNIVGCTSVRIDGLTCDVLTIDAGSSNTSMGRVSYTAGQFTDSSSSTKLITQSSIDYNPPLGGRVWLGFNQATPIIAFGSGLDCNLQRPSTNYIGAGAADLGVLNAGRGLRVAEGSNAKQGVATLVAGTVVVSNTSVTASSRIMLTPQDNSTAGALRVSARTAGTSFTITSSNGADTGVVAYQIFEPG